MAVARRTRVGCSSHGSDPDGARPIRLEATFYPPTDPGRDAAHDLHPRLRCRPTSLKPGRSRPRRIGFDHNPNGRRRRPSGHRGSGARLASPRESVTDRSEGPPRFASLPGLRGLPRGSPQTWPTSSGRRPAQRTCPQNSNVNVMQERRQLALSAPGDGFSFVGLRLSGEERAGRAGVLSGSIGPKS